MVSYPQDAGSRLPPDTKIQGCSSPLQLVLCIVDAGLTDKQGCLCRFYAVETDEEAGAWRGEAASLKCMELGFSSSCVCLQILQAHTLLNSPSLICAFLVAHSCLAIQLRVYWTFSLCHSQISSTFAFMPHPSLIPLGLCLHLSHLNLFLGLFSSTPYLSPGLSPLTACLLGIS